jgi:hypothetical protein
MAVPVTATIGHDGYSRAEVTPRRNRALLGAHRSLSHRHGRSPEPRYRHRPSSVSRCNGPGVDVSACLHHGRVLIVDLSSGVLQ